MADREKIINELVEHIESALDVDSDYVDCVQTDLLQTVVGLLKEQENSIPISWFEQYTRLKCSESWHNMALAIIETWKTVNNIQKKTNAK